MAKVLSYIGLLSAALGILFMIAGFWVGGTWVFLLAAQVGLPAIVSGIVFMAFGYVVELLESIAAFLRQSKDAALETARSKTGQALRLNDIAPQVRVLRSIGDAVGGLNDRQRSSVVAFVGANNGGELSKEQREEVSRWIDMTAAPLSSDLEHLSNMSAPLLRRFKATLASVANDAGVGHTADGRKAKVENALARIQASLPLEGGAN